MRLVSRGILVVVCFCAAVLVSPPAGAQNWSFDARNVGLGGIGSTSNIALDMVDDERPFRAIVLPFGLFQILPNLPTFDPTSDDFDLDALSNTPPAPSTTSSGATMGTLRPPSSTT